MQSKKYLSPEIVNEQISLMAGQILRDLLQEIREALYFSLIVDEATDISNKEQVCISLRWVDCTLAIHEVPIEFIAVPKTDAATLTMIIKDSLIHFALPVRQCWGQAYDGASNMAGHVSGVAKRIQEEEEAVIFVHCLAHCTNLCLQTTAKQVALIRDTLYFVQEVGQLIRFSPKRSALFDAMQAHMLPGAAKLKPLCPTRWTVRSAAIDSVLKNYSVLKSALSEIHEGRDEYALKAGGFLAAMEKFSTFFGLHLSYLIFSSTEQLSIALQGKDTTLQEAVSASSMAIRHLHSLRNDKDFECFYTRINNSSENLTAEPAVPRHKSCTFDSPKNYFRQQYYEAVDLISAELQNRFQQKRGIPAAAAIENLILNAINAGEYSEIPELELYKKDVNSVNLKAQLQMLPNLLKAYNENTGQKIVKVTTLRTMCAIFNAVPSSKSLFQDIFILLRILLTIPVTTATAERTFSALRRLKTYLRSTMSQPRLDHIMLLHTHKERTDELDMLQVAKSFVSVNERRQLFFGSF